MIDAPDDTIPESSIQITHDAWKIFDNAALFGACYTAFQVSDFGQKGAVNVLFTTDAQMQDLNLEFRHKDAPTNVLSFPGGEAIRPEFAYLGDIALGYETCAHEAQTKNITLRDHAAHLIVHGLLHLAGHDHQHDDEAEVMEQAEIKILRMLGIADPYAQPAQTSTPHKGVER